MFEDDDDEWLLWITLWTSVLMQQVLIGAVVLSERW